MLKRKKSKRTCELVRRQRAIAAALRRQGEAVLNEYLVARQSRVHGFGVFARCVIPRGTRVIEYVGEKISKREAARRHRTHAVYIFELNARVDIDGAVGGNGSHLLNHGCRPNAESRIEHNRVHLYALRRIQPGEEVTYDYRFDVEDYHDYPCRCGAEKCRGFIIDAQVWQKKHRGNGTL